MNKAVQIKRFATTSGDPTSEIQVVELPRPKPGEGEVLVRLTLRPVNPSDVM